jgi:hypothetical protein
MKNQKSPFNVFSWINEITYNKKSWDLFNDEQKSLFEPYIILRFLSMNKDYIDIINYIQSIPLLTKEQYYFILCDFIPKKKIWNKYIKKENKNDIKEEDINYISQYYQCSKKEAREYIEIMKSEDFLLHLEELGINNIKNDGKKRGRKSKI